MKRTPKPKAGLLDSLGRFKKARVMVVGDIMHDIFIWGRVKRISPEAPVPVVEVHRETALLGGAANVVGNVRALGAKAVLAGVVGTDPAGEAVLRELERIGARGACVHRSTRRPTAVKTRIIAHQQQVVRFDREDPRQLKPSTFNKLWRSIKDSIGSVDAVVVSDYQKGLVSEKLMERLKGLCREKGKLLVVDPKPAHADWYRGVDLITPNSQEASVMTGTGIETDEDLERAGEMLLKRLQCKALLITRGEKGMSLFRNTKKPAHIPARAREVYDVTGAGDTVVGAMAVALVAGMDMLDATKAANLAAGIVVGKIGTSVATVEEIKQAMNARKTGNRN